MPGFGVKETKLAGNYDGMGGMSDLESYTLSTILTRKSAKNLRCSFKMQNIRSRDTDEEVRLRTTLIGRSSHHSVGP